MTKKKLTPAQKARKLADKEKFEWIFINGKQKKVQRIPLPSDSYFALWDGKSSLAEYLINLEIAELIKREDEEQEIKEINIKLRLISNKTRSFYDV